MHGHCFLKLVHNGQVYVETGSYGLYIHVVRVRTWLKRHFEKGFNRRCECKVNMGQLNIFDFTHIHIPTNQKVKLKKNYGDISTVYVELYPISITWGKVEYHDTIIVKNQDLKPIENGE